MPELSLSYDPSVWLDVSGPVEDFPARARAVLASAGGDSGEAPAPALAERLTRVMAAAHNPESALALLLLAEPLEPPVIVTAGAEPVEPAADVMAVVGGPGTGRTAAFEAFELPSGAPAARLLDRATMSQLTGKPVVPDEGDPVIAGLWHCRLTGAAPDQRLVTLIVFTERFELLPTLDGLMASLLDSVQT
ncbi:MAG: hypothetical protein LBH76_04420 [Propionibacteriaceae bacterium]|jgi:hypothetical protein|nr:hypothetical protein [Propionibacteriaceae bacterium]